MHSEMACSLQLAPTQFLSIERYWPLSYITKDNYIFLVAYIKHQDKDCLWGNNIHKMSLSSALDFENCKNWCNNNANCGGFTVYRYTAYFKNQSCKTSMFSSEGIIIFVKQED